MGQHRSRAMNGTLPASTASLATFIGAFVHSWRIGLVRSATRYVEFSADWFGIYGCFGSDSTGPGPLFGGRKSSLAPRLLPHPVRPSGLKLGISTRSSSLVF